MTPYADFSFYSGVYGGSLPEPEFSALAVRASWYIDHVTFGRIGPVSDEVRMATCAVIDADAKFADREGVSSETVGAHSVSYGAAGDRTGDTSLAARKYAAAKEYLANTGLMYTGVRR